jgi:hypothetical protein
MLQTGIPHVAVEVGCAGFALNQLLFTDQYLNWGLFHILCGSHHSFLHVLQVGGRTLDVVTRENMKVNTLADNSKMVALKFLYKMHARQNLTDRLLPITLPFFFFDFQSTSALNAACTGSL